MVNIFYRAVTFKYAKKYYFYFFTLYFFLIVNSYLFFASFEREIPYLALFITSTFLSVPIISFFYTQASIKTFFKPVPVLLSHILSTLLILSYFPNLVLFFREGYIVFATVIFYFLLLSSNIFLVVSERGSVIPLLRPAKVTFLQLQIIIAFLLFTSIFKGNLIGPYVEATFLVQTAVIFTVCYAFSWVYWWSQQMEKEISSFTGNESLIIAFTVSFFSLSISFFEMETYFRSLLITAAFYICINFFQSVVNHKYSNKNLLEYALVGILVLAVVLLF